MQKVKLTWQDPLKFAEKIAAHHTENWAFLYSALHQEVKNSSSYIALFPQKEIQTDDFPAAEDFLQKLDNSGSKAFGYFSYEVGQEFEKLPKTEKSFINFPKIWLINFALIFEFDHDKKILTANFLQKEKLEEALKYKALKHATKKFSVKNINSNFTDKNYLAAISDIKKMIANGDFYQTNLTRKFFGKFSKKLNAQQNFQLFKELVKSKAGNYSAFLQLGKNHIISTSPELFFSINKNRQIISRPIKGTAPRSANKIEDQKNLLALKNSSKDRAENLMIVDLVRNDLARICKTGSVVVKNLFQANSYSTVHHLSSEVRGKIDQKFNNCDALRALFSPGSMTGAPKIKAMEIAAKKEKIDRGVYSGSLGFIDSKGETKLSVVIRTLITSEEKFEFQSGGAITFDSDPQQELEEVFAKIKGIKKILSQQSSDFDV
jgi:para-aminobenzoate synthetase component 1